MICTIATCTDPVWAGTAPPPTALLGVPGSTGPAEQADEAWAVSSARAWRRRVEVEGEQSATGSVYANPDGTFTAEEHSRPIHVRRDGGWVPVDPTLRRAAHAITTTATTTPVTFSPGGSGPLAEMAGQGWKMTIDWPANLPTPVLTGDVATYRQVLPGVDLVLRADDAGFSERLVVASREAASNPALREIRFGYRLTGAELSVTRDGGLVARDHAGRMAFSSPPPRMWDAGPGAGGSPAQADVGVAVRDGAILLRPDAAMLADPATRFPVTIDPSYSAGSLAWADVLEQSPGTAFWNGGTLADNGNGKVLVGRDPTYNTRARAFFRMNTSKIGGKHILKATFQITEKWSYSCSASVVELWWTGGISSGSTWNNQPAWKQRIGTANVAKGNENFGCGDGSVEFDTTNIVRDAAADKWADLTVGLRAADETSYSGWKRFDTSPSIAVTYNSVPNTPSELTIDGKPCGAGTFVGSRQPTMSAAVSDPDAGQMLSVSMYWAIRSGTTSETDKVVQSNVASGGRAIMKVPPERLADGGSYYWQAKAGDGTDTSGASAQCAFTVDAVAPSVQPAVTSTDYPGDGDFHGGRGTAGTFALDAAGVTDVVAYRYGRADPPTTEVPATTLGGGATISVTPTAVGINTLYVRSVDRAGNLSPMRAYIYYVGGGSAPVAHWAMNEGGGSTLDDSSADGHPAGLTGTTAWTSDRTMTPAAAVAFDGTSGHAATTGPVVDTDKSFSVSAWVRLTAARWATVVSQGGSTASGMILQFDQGEGHWAIGTQDADAKDPTASRAEAPDAPLLGVWTHLAGTYDSAAGTLTLYVNGRQAGTRSTRISWNATGPLLIGAEKFNGSVISYFPGDITDVRVWDRVVYPDEIAAIAERSRLSGAWDLTSDGADSSGLNHPLAPSGGVTFEPASGHDGGGAAHFDGTGSLTAAGPVVLTDQSFTVSAWVRLSDSSAYHTAVCQQATRTCAFFLQYDKSADRWCFAVHSKDVDKPTAWAARSSTAPAPNTWTHLVGVYDAGRREARLYVNGQQVGSAAGVTAFNAGGPLTVGQARYNGNVADPWKGDIDHVRVHLGALSDGQIVDLFNQ
ncbi:LamG-like jellyroll fold domain-containing protein [Microbispora sp. NPDC049125]|uniref:LamG-like jellyroll fold domain-containing protein n=1 Tax=Microbispora sp. NPDC049125 TaxID=3154929 RepID=UPI0034667071